MARPTKLTPEVRDRIVAAVRAGNYYEPAARSAGISPATLHRWMEKGSKSASGIQREFHDAVKRAAAELEVEITARIRKAASEDWRAGLSLLERRHPDRWGRRQALEHTGADGAPLRIGEVMINDPETRKALRAALRAASDARASESGGTRDGE
jgi:transposase-like protein